MSTVGAFRQAVQDHLEDDLGITVVAGTREGRSEDRDIGYVWVARVAEAGGSVQDETITLGVRIFKQWKQQQGTHRPVTALEDLIETLQTSLAPVRTTLGPWFFRLTDIEPNYEDSYVTGTIEAWQQNMAEV